jgi:sodium-dependent dicarboxylate transporter 2/3/5
MLAALCCSFAMALPVSTPPNAIAYSTADIPLSEMKRVGLRVTVLSTAIALLGYRVVLPLVF